MLQVLKLTDLSAHDTGKYVCQITDSNGNKWNYNQTLVFSQLRNNGKDLFQPMSVLIQIEDCEEAYQIERKFGNLPILNCKMAPVNEQLGCPFTFWFSKCEPGDKILKMSVATHIHQDYMFIPMCTDPSCFMYYILGDLDLVALPGFKSDLQEHFKNIELDLSRIEFNELTFNTQNLSAYECPQGFYAGLDKDPVCVPCAPREFGNISTSTCNSCPSGTYQDGYGMVACNKCPAGIKQFQNAHHCEKLTISEIADSIVDLVSSEYGPVDTEKALEAPGSGEQELMFNPIEDITQIKLYEDQNLTPEFCVPSAPDIPDPGLGKNDTCANDLNKAKGKKKVSQQIRTRH